MSLDSGPLTVALAGLVGAGATQTVNWLVGARRIEADLTINERAGIREDTDQLIESLQEELRRIGEDRDNWRSLFLDSLNAAERALDVAEQEARP